MDLMVVLTRLEIKLDTATAGVADHEARLRAVEQSAISEADVAPLRADVESLKRGRWPLPAISAVAAVVAVVASVVPRLH
ncbi:hypothetical protein [Kitasatospora sp. NPDC094011]|uniref:hypothetical protein n=1 Tax=Kitasatospora sp. NPDC094011 TaxID=3364090 RepID=UPI003802BA74